MKAKQKSTGAAFLVSRGFTLIEVCIALFVLMVGVMALCSMQISAIRNNHIADTVTYSSNYSASQLEDIFGVDYDSNFLNDKNHNGEGGLNDTVNPDYGGQEDASGKYAIDAKFTLGYNVAVDSPIKGIKKIRVHTKDSSTMLQSSVAYETLKNDAI